jgi:hypothetical protein
MSHEPEQDGPAMRKAITGYFHDRVELMRLELAEKAARLSADLAVGAILAMLGFFVLLFISLMAAYFISQLSGSLFTGFAIVASSYLLLLVVLLIWGKKWIGPRVSDTVVKIFFEESDPENLSDVGK